MEQIHRIYNHGFRSYVASRYFWTMHVLITEGPSRSRLWSGPGLSKAMMASAREFGLGMQTRHVERTKKVDKTRRRLSTWRSGSYIGSSEEAEAAALRLV